MSGWKWKLRRTIAMSPGEIAVRLWHAARDRAISVGVLRPYPVEPVECFRHAWREDARLIYQRFLQRFPCSRHPHERWREYLYREHPQQVADILAQAEAMLQGKMYVLGFEVQTDVPPSWFRNYVQGGEWPALPAQRIDYRLAGVAGGGALLLGAQSAWVLAHPGAGMVAYPRPPLRRALAEGLAELDRVQSSALRYQLEEYVGMRSSRSYLVLEPLVFSRMRPAPRASPATDSGQPVATNLGDFDEPLAGFFSK